MLQLVVLLIGIYQQNNWQSRTSSGTFSASRYSIQNNQLNEVGSQLRVRAYGWFTGNTGNVTIGVQIGMSGSAEYGSNTTASAGGWCVDAIFKVYTNGTLSSPGAGFRAMHINVYNNSIVKYSYQGVAHDASYTNSIYASISAAATVYMASCEWEIL